MSACWMFVILMGCRLGPSHSTQPQSTCVCHDQLKTFCVPPGDNVTVSCPKLDANHVIFKLLQDEEMIFNHSYIRDKKALNYKPPHSRVVVELHEDKENISASFRLTGLNASSHGIYRCEGTVIFPPPLRTVSSDWRILVLLEGHQCRIHAKPPENCGFHWIWIIALVSIYSIIATIIAIVIWVKLRRTDSQSDYMNTKPQAPRERRKKRGVQNPIPRHF
ncbi:T-cell-specific surface glycoprotein CD28 homolog [Chaetodon trifascialis]|uniref:T-cell-specific surface glycoprotein CD28 homolog n=1 Tax=Chaetodon trifascialis TaxID=109706 RepID=UPI0039954133